MTRSRRLLQLLFSLLFAGCLAETPPVHHYALNPPRLSGGEAIRRIGAGLVITVEELDIDTAYDDRRIVYRPDRVRFEYYHYHRWNAPPSQLMSDFLRDAYARTGAFRRVGRSVEPATSLVVGGRIRALEEVDVAPDRWLARVALELHVEDPQTGEILWAQSYDEHEPMAEQSPAGLARAVSIALGRIAADSLPAIARLAAPDRHEEARRTSDTGPSAASSTERPPMSLKSSRGR